MNKEESNTVIWIYNYFGYGLSYDGNVFDKQGLTPALLASNCHGNTPKFIIVEEEDEHTL